MASTFDRLTVYSQQAVHRAVPISQDRSHQQLMPLHLLSALLREEQGIVRPLIEKIGANLGQLESMVDGELDRLPKVTGDTAQMGASTETMQVLEKALATAEQMKDAFVSTEHLLLALSQVDNQAHRLLELNGIEEKDVLSALKSVRGGQNVSDQNPEEKYQALERYGHDLVDLARQGKIDPVIGRDTEIRRIIQALSRRRKNNPVLIG